MQKKEFKLNKAGIREETLASPELDCSEALPLAHHMSLPMSFVCHKAFLFFIKSDI